MKDKIKQYFIDKNNSLISFEELAINFKLSDDDYQYLSDCLCELENEFIIMHNKQGLFANIKLFNLFYGKFTKKADGFGFIDSELGDSLFVPKNEASLLLNGDLVLARIKTDSNGKKEAIIERIVKRAHTEFVGKIVFFHKRYFIDSLNNYGADILIEKENLGNASVGDLVCATPIEYFPTNLVTAKVTKVFGSSNVAYMDLIEIAASLGAKTSFDEETLSEAKLLENSHFSIPDGYIDETDKCIITIDGSDAKDFDDAVSLNINDSGNYELGIFIADVTNYVKEDSFLDNEAQIRGCSTYLPGMVIPMLPSVLSDDLCSLKEGVNRLTLAVKLEYNLKGKLLSHKIYNAVIKSSHRMTYEDCNKILDGDSELSKKYSDILNMLNQMADLAEILQYNRSEAGAFDFGTVENKIILDKDGKTKDVVIYNRGVSEQIIEEFMIATNECIASDFEYLNVPFIYRVHATPDEEKIAKLLIKLSGIGYNINNKKTKNINYLLKNIIKDNDINEPNLKEEELARRVTINNEIIRSMPKAIYQETNIGHFGLSLKAYTHFTSPIRRYPDLLVHRLVKTFLLNKDNDSFNTNINKYKNIVNVVSANSSKLERMSEMIERDSIKYKECEYMAKFIGLKFSGTITSITSFGIFVALDNLIEGLSRYSFMNGYYEFNEELGLAVNAVDKITYKIGDRVQIRVLDVDKNKRNIDFKILRKE